MKNVIAGMLLGMVLGLAPAARAADSAEGSVLISGVNAELAAKFARLALDCVHREYPNKVSHVLNSAADAQPPSTLYPVF